jgi:hypothetical protein
MNQSQRELRRAAAQAFMESLDQLGRSLTPAEPAYSSPKTLETPETSQFAMDLEAAVADIEEFTQNHQPCNEI